MIERGNPLSLLGERHTSCQSSFFHEKTKHVILEEEETHDRTVQPVVYSQREARPQQFIIGNDEAELELSLRSRSFLDMEKTKNDLRWMLQKTDEKTFCDMGNVHVCNIGISSIHGKELLSQSAFHQEYKRSHNETNDRHICTIGVRTRWDLWSENNWLWRLIIHGSICLWLVMNKSSVFSARRSTSFQILHCVLVRYTRTSYQKLHGKTDWRGSKVHWNTEAWTELMVSQWNSEWNIFPGFNTLQLSQEVKSLLLKLGETPENFKGRIIFMSMFNDISCGSRDNEKECESNAQLVSLYAKRFGIGQWSFLGPGSEKKWYSISADIPQGEWDRIAEKMMLEFGESKHPVFRATSPLSRGQLQSKGGGKLSIHYCADQKTIKNCFSHNYFCKSAQSLRSSRRNVWRIRNLSR